MTALMRHNTPVVSSLNVVLGLWLFLSPLFVVYSSEAGRLDNVLLGIAIAGAAAVRALGLAREPTLSWINALLGAWVLAAPWVLGFRPVMGNLICGVTILILAVGSAIASQQTYSDAM
jgi:hypothetical protein